MGVTFYDEKAGRAWMGLSVNDRLVDSWTGNKQYKMTTHQLPQPLWLKPGDQLRIDFYTESKMRCRIDCIDIQPDPTGISSLPAAEAQGRSTTIYDLSGRRVGRISRPGIYIIGHRKVIVPGK